jgi:hypothetical protein
VTDSAEQQRATIRRWVGWTLVVTLCIAAFTAIVAILSGEFDEDDWRVIGASLGFGVFSALGASGASLRLRASERLRALGLATLLLAAASYVVLLAALFVGDDDEGSWQLFGILSLGAFSASHACVVVGAMRDTDGAAVRSIAITSIVLSVVDSGIGILAIAGTFENMDDPEAFVRFVAVLVVLLLLTTALPPIMRRLQTQPAATPAEPSQAPAPLATEVIAVVDRIEALNADPGNNAPLIRRECERLRELARGYSR